MTMSHRIGSRFSEMLKRWTLLGKVCTSAKDDLLRKIGKRRGGMEGELENKKP